MHHFNAYIDDAKMEFRPAVAPRVVQDPDFFLRVRVPKLRRGPGPERTRAFFSCNLFRLKSAKIRNLVQYQTPNILLKIQNITQPA